ncbi:hypothetical protein HGRIS_005040 [Hohenbuehelia grisea]|uniref:Uncharacterized protein n=1 Tax=Hohenbuehelia grisea TaxID=104357 RepID=A0ABR3JEF1_9AGAR
MPIEDQNDADLAPEDVLSSSLESLYQYQPITYASAGSLLTYVTKSKHLNTQPVQITVRTPDTQAANWDLHASSIWVSAHYLADHIHELHLEEVLAESERSGSCTTVLELGAGAGLPGVLIAKLYGAHGAMVTLSDYPDEYITRTLIENVADNGVSSFCRVAPYAWGADITPLLPSPQDGFDIIIAADTLWNRASHEILIQTLCAGLKRTRHARIHLVAGLHTGRYTLQSFMNAISSSGFEIARAEEREVQGLQRRDWDISRSEGEDEAERRRWVVWMILKWASTTLGQTE